jgi:hypothetical protein
MLKMTEHVHHDKQGKNCKNKEIKINDRFLSIVLCRQSGIHYFRNHQTLFSLSKSNGYKVA